MPKYIIDFGEDDFRNGALIRNAKALNISVEQYIKRIISEWLRSTDNEPSRGGESFQNFLEKNDVLKPTKDN